MNIFTKELLALPVYDQMLEIRKKLEEVDDPMAIIKLPEMVEWIEKNKHELMREEVKRRKENSIHNQEK